MIGLLIALMAQATATPTPIVAPPCSVEIVGTKEVFTVSYYLHEDPDRRGYRFRMKGLLYTRTDETVTVLADWQPVAFEWYTRPVGANFYTVAETCGEIPTLAFEDPKSSTDPPPPCPLEVTDETELYLKAHYLNEDPLNAGYRYGYRTVSFVTENETLNIPVEEPVAFEVIEYRGPGETLFLLATCGEIPSEVYPTDPTPTPVPATPTSIPATPTTLPSATPTATATSTPTDTPVPPTMTPTPTPTSTSTPTATSTHTPTPTATPTIVPTPIPQGPFNGPHNIPGKIQAEDFDIGGPTVAYLDMTPLNQGDSLHRSGEGADIKLISGVEDNGHAIGFMQDTEWLEYTISVASARDNYILSFRVLSPNDTGRIHAEIDGVDVTGEIVVPQTGDWDTDNWTTVEIEGITMTAGDHVLRVVVDAQYLDLNWIEFTVPSPIFDDDFETGDMTRWGTR